MNLRLLAKHLGTICLLIGATMFFAMPWALPQLGHRADVRVAQPFEWDGFEALVKSILICGLVGIGLSLYGRQAKGRMFRKEAMAVVGLSWMLATVLGGLPYFFSDTYRSASVRTTTEGEPVQIFDFNHKRWAHWITKDPVSADTFPIVQALLTAGARGLSEDDLRNVRPDAVELLDLLRQDEDWRSAILIPGYAGPPDRQAKFRLRWVQMNFADSLFESQSGFSTTGATVISDLEDPHLISHCILFWRSLTHYLGGLGIIVLFVVILGQGSAGKAMMRAEMPGPSKEGYRSRMQHTAWIFAAIYCALNIVLTLLLKVMGLTWFDALCHAFGTMATGGFSTYNASVGHFDSLAIDTVIILFMGLAGTNFILLYLTFLGRPGRLFSDPEWRVYAGIIVLASTLVVLFGLYHDDFRHSPEDSLLTEVIHSARYGVFQVISIVTTTGYGTHDFDSWNSFGRGILFLLMFVGGCAGSTGGGLKVIRHVLFVKVLRLEIEHSFHPTVVRPLKLGGRVVEDLEVRKNILVYFGLILIIFVLSWLLIVTVEPDVTWGNYPQGKLLDTASAVAATLNNIGPGLGIVGATQNYGHFSSWAKLHFTWLMMVGRVEIFAIIVLFVPKFWRNH